MGYEFLYRKLSVGGDFLYREPSGGKVFYRENLPGDNVLWGMLFSMTPDREIQTRFWTNFEGNVSLPSYFWSVPIYDHFEEAQAAEYFGLYRKFTRLTLSWVNDKPVRNDGNSKIIYNHTRSNPMSSGWKCVGFWYTKQVLSENVY